MRRRRCGGASRSGPACIAGAGSKGRSAIRQFATRCVSPFAPPIGRGRAKAPAAITRDILDQLLATCGRGRAVDLRDRALLLLAFGSGGRRRSEIARLKVDDLEEREPVAADP